MSQINPLCNCGSEWIYVGDESGPNIDVFFGTRKRTRTQEWIKVRWMVPQLSLPFQEALSLYTHPFFPRRCIPLVSLLLPAKSGTRGAMKDTNGGCWWVGGYGTFWAAPETHRLLGETEYNTSSQEDMSGVWGYSRIAVRALWDRENLLGPTHCLPQGGPGPSWHTSSKCEFPFLCRAGMPQNQPRSENTMEHWVRADHSEFWFVKLKDVQKQRSNIFV